MRRQAAPAFAASMARCNGNGCRPRPARSPRARSRPAPPCSPASGRTRAQCPPRHLRPADLGDGGRRVLCRRVGHGLHADRRVAADEDLAHPDLAGRPAGDLLVGPVAHAPRNPMARAEYGRPGRSAQPTARFGARQARLSQGCNQPDAGDHERRPADPAPGCRVFLEPGDADMVECYGSADGGGDQDAYEGRRPEPRRRDRLRDDHRRAQHAADPGPPRRARRPLGIGQRQLAEYRGPRGPRWRRRKRGR